MSISINLPLHQPPVFEETSSSTDALCCKTSPVPPHQTGEAPTRPLSCSDGKFKARCCVTSLYAAQRRGGQALSAVWTMCDRTFIHRSAARQHEDATSAGFSLRRHARRHISSEADDVWSCSVYKSNTCCFRFIKCKDLLLFFVVWLGLLIGQKKQLIIGDMSVFFQRNDRLIAE